MDIHEFLERARLVAMRARAESTAADLASVAPRSVGAEAVNLLCELLPAALTDSRVSRDERRKRAFRSSDDLELLGITRRQKP